MTFADEQPGRWEDHEWEDDRRPTVTALYAPWQQLCASDAIRGGTFTAPLWVFLADAEPREHAHEQLRGWAEGQDQAWRELDEAWRPLIQTLVRLQNRYWPELTLRTTLLWDPETRERSDPYPAERTRFDARNVLAEDLGGDRDGILAAYHFLVERGMDLDPHDGLMLLRRAVPRAFHSRWQDKARLSQDHFDAAELLRRFLVDVDGRQPPLPSALPMDGRQPERELLYKRGPAAPWDGREVVQALQATELYPHGVHVIHEGRSERTVIEQLLKSLVGPAALAEVNFTDLGGVGTTALLEDLVASLQGYARRTVLVLDNEAKAREHVEALIEAGTIPASDVLLFDTSLEEANASAGELVQLAVAIAKSHGIELALTGEELLSFHAEARAHASENGREPAGLSTSLIRAVSRSTRGQWHLRKSDLIEALGNHLIAELHDTAPGVSARPVVTFVATRIFDALNRPYPVGGG